MTPHLTRTAATALAAAILLALAPSAVAASEQDDAGDLPASAQDLGASAVTVIDGAFTSGGDADMYRLCLTGGRTFSASTVGGSERDTQLFLFNSGGFGVYANDDADSGVRTSLLPAGHEFTPSAAGEYFLAISSFNREPQSSLGPIFPDTFAPIVVDASDSGASEPVSDWAGLNRGAPGSYLITLTGTAECTAPDTTAPTVDLRSPADGARVKQGAEVVVDFSCADEAGGSGVASCTGTLADGALLDTSSLGPMSVTVTARDHAGNETVVTHTVTVVDQTAPSISVSSPATGAVYELGQQVVADYACQDELGGSGVTSCVGSVAPGQPLDTSSVGTKTFTVEASDAAGNSATETVSYSVIYDFDGFRSPLANLPQVNRWKAGAAVPVRFSLGAYRGPVPVAPGYPKVAAVQCASGAQAAGTERARGSWKKAPARATKRARWTHMFLWKTDKTWAGSCRQFVLKLDDGTLHRLEFQFVRRGNDRDSEDEQ